MNCFIINLSSSGLREAGKQTGFIVVLKPVMQKVKKSDDLLLRGTCCIGNQYRYYMQRVIIIFNGKLPIRCHKTSLRAFISEIAGIALIMRQLHREVSDHRHIG